MLALNTHMSVCVCMSVCVGEPISLSLKMVFVGGRTSTNQQKVGNVMSELIKALTSLLAGAPKGRWASTNEKKLDLKSGSMRTVYMVLAPVGMNAGDAIVVKKRSGEIGLWVLTTVAGNHFDPNTGVSSHFWNGTQIDPFTGEVIGTSGSHSIVEMR